MTEYAAVLFSFDSLDMTSGYFLTCDCSESLVQVSVKSLRQLEFLLCVLLYDL